MRSVRFSPPPPIQIGSSAAPASGSQRASCSSKHSPSKSVDLLAQQAAHALDGLLELVEAHLHRAGTGCRRRRTRSRSSRRRARGRPGRRSAGRSWRSRWPAPPGAGSRRSTRASRTRTLRRVAGERGVGGDRLEALSVAGERRPRRSGPRSRSSRSRGPRPVARAPGARHRRVLEPGVHAEDGHAVTVPLSNAALRISPSPRARGC